jgi:hypothetical protein
MSQTILSTDSRAASDRARIQLMLSLVADIAGFDPDYISVTPGVKPPDFDGSGSPYGWYVRSVSGEQYIQPVQWNAGALQWDHIGSPQVTLNALTNRLAVLETELKENSGFLVSDVTDGGESAVTTDAAITNIISLTQAEYDALDTVNATTMYLITDSA